MITADYPAAHSMDTAWFAVDRHGHVGVFATGEPGHMPAALPEETSVYDVVVPLLANLFPGQPRADVDDLAEEFDLASACGLFVYDYPDEYSLIGLLYRRERTPRLPLHIDQLPPEVRVLCQRQRFEALDFTQDELIQPAEHVGCKGWHLEAYLDRDGVTVRPLPGQEARFAEFVRDFLQKNPEAAGRYVFTPPAEEEGSQAT
jgi:hypothetical protein